MNNEQNKEDKLMSLLQVMTDTNISLLENQKLLREKITELEFRIDKLESQTYFGEENEKN